MPRKKGQRTGEPTEAEVPTTIRLPKSWHKALKVKAAQEESTMADLIRDALRAQYDLKAAAVT